MSDELINYSCFSNVMATSREREIAKNAMEDVRSMYEAARTKDAELIEFMLNYMQDFIDKCDRGEAKSKRSYAAFKRCIELAAAQGFKPSDQ